MKQFNVIIVLLFLAVASCSTNKDNPDNQNLNEEVMGLNVGDKIPEILGLNQDSIEVKASDYTGKKLVLYFYPKDSTPGCTAQACNLRDNYEKLMSEGYQVLGVSVDDIASHKKFIEKQNLPFPLIADTDKKLVEAFGVWGEQSFLGKTYMGTARTTFIIDENGVVEEIISKKEIKTKDHTAQILKEENK